jgi:hypothetical protein
MHDTGAQKTSGTNRSSTLRAVDYEVHPTFIKPRHAFARRVSSVAGIYRLVALFPQYFMEETSSRTFLLRSLARKHASSSSPSRSAGGKSRRIEWGYEGWD